MKRNLIKTDNYLLVFDKLSEIKEGDWYKTPLGIYSQFNGTEKLPIGTRRVASHAPLNGAPYLDGGDVLPSLPQEDDVDSICMKDLQDFFGTDIHLTPKGEEYISIFKTVYNKSREKYKFTEEDMRKAIIMSSLSTVDFIPDRCDVIIQTIQQPKYPIAFECETYEELVDGFGRAFGLDGSNEPVTEHKPKTIINDEGETEWVGKYIYN